MNENELSELIFDCCFRIHRTLGAGLFESVYEEILAYELSKKNLNFKRQKAISLTYGDIKLDAAFRADFICREQNSIYRSAATKEKNIDHG